MFDIEFNIPKNRKELNLLDLKYIRYDINEEEKQIHGEALFNNILAATLSPATVKFHEFFKGFDEREFDYEFKKLRTNLIRITKKKYHRIPSNFR